MSNHDKFLIISLSRSGGKLLRSLFDGHPSLKVFPFEHWNTRLKCQFDANAHELFANLPPKKKLRACGFPSHTRPLLERHHSAEVVGTLMARMVKGAEHCKSFGDIYDLFTHELFKLMGDESRKPIVVNHCGSLCVLSRDQIDMIYGRNRKVMTVRDPRAVFRSIDALRAKKFRARPQTKSEIAVHESRNFLDGREGSYLHEFCLRYKAMVQNHVIEKGQVVLVKFEDLVADTEKSMRRVTSELDIPFHECLLQPTETGLPKAANTSFTRQPLTVDPAAAHDWQGRLPKDAEKYIVASLAPEMELLGYR